MAEIRESVLNYINASKRLLAAEAVSEKEREIVLKYLHAIEKLITTEKDRDASL